MKIKPKFLLMFAVFFLITDLFGIDIFYYSEWQRFAQDTDLDEYISFNVNLQNKIFNALTEKKQDGISFKMLNENKKAYPYIELKYHEGSRGSMYIVYKINYSINVSMEYRTECLFDEMSSPDERLSCFVNAGVLAVESIIPFIQEKYNSSLTKKIDESEKLFYIDTIDLGNYISHEVEPVMTSIGMSLCANNDNSFVVKFDDAIRLYAPNGNILYDYTNVLKDLGMKSTKEALVANVDETIYVISGDNVTKAYAFKGNEFFGKQDFYCANIVSPYFIKNGTANGYPLIYDFSTQSMVSPSFIVGEDKVYDFIKNAAFTLVRETKDNNIAKILFSTVNIYDKYGNLKKIITMEDVDSNLSSNQFVFLGDDFFITSNSDSNSYIMYSFDGKVIWSLPKTGYLSGYEFADYKNGILYFTAFWGGTKTICRVGTGDFLGPEYLKEIGSISEAISENPYDAKLYKSLYETYLKYGGESLAYSAITKYLERSPADAKTFEQKLKFELSLQKETLKQEVQDVFALYDEIGEISATQSFYSVASKIERLLRQFPNDEDLNKDYNDMLELFGRSSNASNSNSDELIIEEIDLAVLFPALKNVYASNPCGFMTVRNNSGKNIKNITVSTKLKKYTDYETESKAVKFLENGKTCVLDLFVPLNEYALNVQENTNVQIQYTVNWDCDGKKNKINVTRPVTIYKKSAMCWNDTRMLSCFILPNDSSVVNFSTEALSVKNKNVVLNKNINTVATLVDAIGAIPLTYVSDPNVSFSSIVDNDFAIDTVRFPNETLKLKGGDCDDMTTLFCSVLESVGISTAIITVPGHIMAAFDIGEKSNLIWDKLNDDTVLKTIEYDGKIFIPIETTVMTDGFIECWKSASKNLIDDDAIEEFIVINEQRATYPPVTVDVGPEKLSVNLENVVAQKAKDRDEINDFFENQLDVLSKTSAKGEDLNVIAKMYHLLGNDNSAINVLLKAIKIDSDYLPAYNNLASLYKSLGHKDKYQEIAELATKKQSGAKKVHGGTVNARASESEDEWDE